MICPNCNAPKSPEVWLPLMDQAEANLLREALHAYQVRGPGTAWPKIHATVLERVQRMCDDLDHRYRD